MNSKFFQFNESKEKIKKEKVEDWKCSKLFDTHAKGDQKISRV